MQIPETAKLSRKAERRSQGQSMTGDRYTLVGRGQFDLAGLHNTSMGCVSVHSL